MAFEHLCGQVMTDSNGTIYIISDNFSVIYPGDAHPDVYEWADISAVKIDKSSITVTTGISHTRQGVYGQGAVYSGKDADIVTGIR